MNVSPRPPQRDYRPGFWPTRYQLIGGAGCLLGAFAGPGLFFLMGVLWDKYFPSTFSYSPLFFFAALAASIPFGIVVGTAIAMAIAEKTKK